MTSLAIQRARASGKCPPSLLLSDDSALSLGEEEFDQLFVSILHASGKLVIVRRGRVADLHPSYPYCVEFRLSDDPGILPSFSSLLQVS
jgi:hypothetical protein